MLQTLLYLPDGLKVPKIRVLNLAPLLDRNLQGERVKSLRASKGQHLRCQRNPVPAAPIKGKADLIRATNSPQEVEGAKQPI